MYNSRLSCAKYQRYVTRRKISLSAFLFIKVETRNSIDFYETIRINESVISTGRNYSYIDGKLITKYVCT